MKKQNGAALMVVLVLLSASLILGVASMQSSLIDERLAGNYKATIEAQMRAEAAAAEAVGNSVSWDDKSPFLESFEVVREARWAKYAGHDQAIQPTNGEVCPKSSCFYLPIRIGGHEWIMAMGAVLSSEGVLIAESDPVFVQLASEGGGSFGSTSVLGGMREGALQLPSSSRSRFFGGSYTEGGGNFDVMAFMIDEGLGSYTRQDVLDMGNKAGLDRGNTKYFKDDLKSRLNFLHQLYQKHQESGGNQTSRGGGKEACSGLCFYENDLKETGNQTLEGVHIVLNGHAQIGGNVDIQGVLIILNLDADNDGKLEDAELLASQWHAGLTKQVKFNGGGNKGTVWFDERAVRDALSSVNISLEEFFNAGGGSGAESGIAIWR